MAYPWDLLHKAIGELGSAKQCVQYTSPPDSDPTPPHNFKIYDKNTETHYYFKINNLLESGGFGIILECDIYTRKRKKKYIIIKKNYSKFLVKIIEKP